MNILNRMINRFLLGIGVGVFIIISGCAKYLSQEDPSNITVSNFYTEPNQAESAINDIYADLRPVYDGGGYGGSPWLMLEFPTGLANTTVFGSAGTKNSNVRNLIMASDNPYLTTFWQSYYRGIANANLAIEKIPDIQMDDIEKKRLIGEAKFLRAYYYFNLVRIFGDVPLILEPLTLASKQLMPKRDSIKKIYDVIIKDLRDAEDSGLPFTDKSGRASLGAVKALMASVYLTLAGYPLQAGSEYFKLARDKAAEIINSHEYQLFDSYADLRNKEKDNIEGNIFMVQYSDKIVNRNGFQALFLPANSDISLYSDATGMLFPMEGFVNSYERGDKRIQEKQFYYKKFTLASNRNDTVTFGDWYIYKWFDSLAHTQTASSGLNWPLFRYAEILFIYAEASNEVSGPTSDAYEAINKIRRRADLEPLSHLEQNDFREAIWKEKWHEMCFENKTWFDMVRLRKAYNYTTDSFDSFVGHKFEYGPTLSEKDLLFPIPVAEIKNNKNLTQNPGY